VLKAQGKQFGTPTNLTPVAQAQSLMVRQQNARIHEANRQATVLILARRWGMTRSRRNCRAWSFAPVAGAASPTNKSSAWPSGLPNRMNLLVTFSDSSFNDTRYLGYSIYRIEAYM
jgi:hypothetical protein